MFVELLGDRVIERKLRHVAATRANMRLILRGPVADVIFEIEAQIFQGQGRRGGGSWKQLTPAWLNRKIENGLDPRIGHATLALRRAFTVREAEHQRLVATSQSLTISSSLPQAVPQQRERPFVDFSRLDRIEIAAVIKHQLNEAWRRG
jgi:hypothetical protein